MKRATEKALKKMAGNGYPDVREALEEITRMRAALVSIARAHGADNETVYEMRKIAREALGDE
jgi:transposase-like protein